MLLTLIALACAPDTSSSVEDTASECNSDAVLTQIDAVFRDAYLWYDQVPQVDPTDYASPGDLVDALVYAERDHWSYVVSADTQTAWFDEGRYLGLGMALTSDAAGDVVFAMVYPGSPAGQAGIVRGDLLVGVNGLSAQQITDQDAWSTVWGDGLEGTEVDLEVSDSAGERHSYTLVVSWIDVQTVLATTLFKSADTTVGYFFFSSFLDTSVDELDALFGQLQDADVDELIVDLRYNGGGRLGTAQVLASLIAGPEQDDQVLTHYAHNDRHTDWDFDDHFASRPVSLGLDRVFFIVGPGSASASESLINGLSPWLDVVLVGDTTYGKPVGMYGWEICDLALVPIAFRLSNAQGTTDYFDGLPVDCAAEDTLSAPLGSVDDASVAAALALIDGEDCPVERAPRAQVQARPELWRPVGGY